MLGPVFDLQGHRGARGLKPENTLPAFEAALDVGVTSVETDIHLTYDHVPVLLHDPLLTARLCRHLPGVTGPQLIAAVPVAQLPLARLRGLRADRNPYPERFPGQDNRVTPLAERFSAARQVDPFTPPTLHDLFVFAEAYGGAPGREAGKTSAQQDRARRVRFDLELKRVPFRPAIMGDGYAGQGAALLEQLVVAAARQAGVLDRTSVRSFDHRAVAALHQLEPRLATAVLVAGTAPVAPAELARQAAAQVYCPDVEFLDETQVKQLHAKGIRVVPWTVNEPEDWQRLLDWGVDGITTDFPDRLAGWLRQQGIAY